MWYKITIYIAFYLFILFFSRYVYDDIDADCPVKLHCPKLSDLDLNDFKSMIPYEQKAEKYIDNHIKPAYYYFILRNKLSSIKDSYGFFTAFFLQCIAIAPIFIQITNFLRNISYIFQAVFVILSIALMFGINCTVERIPICKRTIFIPRFEYADEKQLRDRFKAGYSNNDFEISEDNAFNNFVLDIHFGYLLDIEKTVLLRKNWKTGIWAITLFGAVLLGL